MTPRWQRTLACGLLAGLLASASLGARANPHRLDDTGTYTVPPMVQMQWRERVGALAASGMEATLRVHVRIDTKRWIGRRGRIYLALARDETQSIEARWTTLGRLQPGSVRSGERTLVWAGSVTAATLEDQLLMTLLSGADWQANTRRLNFQFEFDAD